MTQGPPSQPGIGLPLPLTVEGPAQQTQSVFLARNPSRHRTRKGPSIVPVGCGHRSQTAINRVGLGTKALRSFPKYHQAPAKFPTRPSRMSGLPTLGVLGGMRDIIGSYRGIRGLESDRIPISGLHHPVGSGIKTGEGLQQADAVRASTTRHPKCSLHGPTPNRHRALNQSLGIGPGR